MIIKFLVIAIAFVSIMAFLLVLVDNGRRKSAPTLSEKRKREKKELAKKTRGNFDEELSLNEKILKNVDMTHGSARWVTDNELQKLIENNKFRVWKIGDDIQKNTAGIVIAQLDDKHLLYNGGDDHSMTIACTGGGKTTTLVAPTALLLVHSGENILVNDPKMELYIETSKTATALGYTVYNLNLIKKDTGGRWNPFWITFEKYLSNDSKLKNEAIDEISKIESLLSEIEKGDSSSEPIWQESEKQIYSIGIVLMFELVKRKMTIYNEFKDKKDYIKNEDTIIYDNMLVKCGDKIENTLKMIMDGKTHNEIEHSIKMTINFGTLFNIVRHISTREDDNIGENGNESTKIKKIPKIKDIIDRDLELNYYEHILYVKSEILLDSAEETYQSMMATPKTKLAKLSNPLVIDLLSGYPGLDGYIDTEMIARTDKNIIYTNVGEDDRTFAYIIQMFVTTMYSTLKNEAHKNKNAKLDTKFHFLLEEAGNLPAFEGICGMLTLSRGIGIRFNLVLQSYKQLSEVYNEDIKDIMISNTMQVILPVNDYETAKEVSDMLGNATIEDIVIEEETESERGNLSAPSTKFKESVRTSNIARAIKTADEILILEMGNAYIKKQQLRPLKTKMPIMFKNEQLSSFLKKNKTQELIPRCIEKNTIVPDDIDFLIKQKDIESFKKKVESSKKIEFKIA